MPKSYNPTEVEKKWQAAWEAAHINTVDLKKAKKPFMNMVMFPYPSGDKLHVGHWYNFGPTDTFGRYMRMQGYDVFEPMGFDAFGLPAENYAIKTGVPPAKSIAANVERMIVQLKAMGCMYDWEKMLNTSTPEYYRWTQWLFLQMFKNGLAYKKLGNVNFCPSCQTVLANEQCQDGKCERCSTDVVQKPLDQWFWNIKKYSQRLLDGLPELDWPEKTKLMQQNWIGRSEGVNFKFKVKDFPLEFEVFDSVPQTFRAQTFAVIAPEHPDLPKLLKGMPNEKEALALIERIKKKKAADKFDVDKDMEGIFTGRYVEFVTGDLPLWIASFVVMDYGTGIVNCSAHDERDFAFAKKYNIPLRTVMLPEDPKEAEKVKNFEYCYAKDPNAIMQLPEEFKGRRWGEVREDIIKYIEKLGLGYETVTYRLRDWLVSRQRYWGAPIPIVYDPSGKAHAIPEEHLPWLLPTDVEFKPNGQSPLRDSKEFKERTEKIFGKGWTPEYDTMDTFVCSSFYQLRYLMQGNAKKFIDANLEKKWMPVSMYIGGPEHACMHLIYARFVMMALKDFGVVSHAEPFKRLVHQGLITNQGAKMSKSKGNVVSPDDFVVKHGADVFRMYLMFMGPFTAGGDWSDTGIKGIDRFVERLWRKFGEVVDAKDEDGVLNSLHRAIKRVSESLESMSFNTAISSLMELLNEVEGKTCSRATAQTIACLLAPLAPHLAEELWEAAGGKGFAIQQTWPTYNAEYLVSNTITLAVQVNGKLRANITVPTKATKEEILAAAKADPNVQKYLAEAPLKKEIYVPGRIVSFVI